MKTIRVALVMLFASSMLLLVPAAAGAAPVKPFTVSPANDSLDVTANPTLQASAYAGSPGHKAAEWQLDTFKSFTDPEWTRTSSAAETQTVVDAANGNFAYDLAGKTGLDSNQRYYWRVRYEDYGSNWGE